MSEAIRSLRFLVWSAERKTADGTVIPEVRHVVPKSIYDGVVVEEAVDVRLVNGFLANPALGIQYRGNPKYCSKTGRFSMADVFDNENQVQQKYRDCYDIHTQTFNLQFKEAAHGYGRIYNSVSLGSQRKETRHTYCEPEDGKPVKKDCDISNCQPTIAAQLAKDNEIDCKYLQGYAENPDEYRQAVIDAYGRYPRKPAPPLKTEAELSKKEIDELVAKYGSLLLRPHPQPKEVDRNMAKELFFSGTFGGSINSWLLEVDPYDDFKGMKMPDIVLGYFADLAKVSGLVTTNNPQIAEAVLLQDPTYFNVLDKPARKATATVPASTAVYKVDKHMVARTTMGLFFQTMERLVQECGITGYIEHMDGGVQLKRITPSQDGFMPDAEYCPTEEDEQTMCRVASQAILAKFRISITFEMKPFKLKLSAEQREAKGWRMVSTDADRDMTDVRLLEMSINRGLLDANMDTLFNVVGIALKNSLPLDGLRLWELYARRDKTRNVPALKEAWRVLAGSFTVEDIKSNLRKGVNKVAFKKLEKDIVVAEQLAVSSKARAEMRASTDIDWENLSDASFAKKLGELRFTDKVTGKRTVLFTGSDLKPAGFQFNGVYWKNLDMSDSQIKQTNMDALFEYYQAEFQKMMLRVPNLPKDLIGTIKREVDSLNSARRRSAVLEIFKSDHFRADIKWNKHLHLFIFEDGIVDTSTNTRSVPDPEDYMNMSCGKYFWSVKDTLQEEAIDAAKVHLKRFFQDVTDCGDFILFLMSSFLVQANEENEGWFWLGAGRNGKGTLSDIVSNALGAYFGLLNIEHYTMQAKSADSANSNLADCEFSRILMTSEVNETDGKGGALIFNHSAFCGLTGGDTVNTRDLFGKAKDRLKYKPGKAVIQVNKMPSFHNIHKSVALTERIKILLFPYSYVSSTAGRDPSIYRLKDTSLKTKFVSEEYRIAFLELLFAARVAPAVPIPDVVEKQIEKYLASQGIQSFIDRYYEFDAVERTPLTDIKHEYETYHGVKTSIAKITEELEAADYKCTKRDVVNLKRKRDEDAYLDM